MKSKKINLIICLLILFVNLAFFQKKAVNVADFDAIADSGFDATVSFQRAIAECKKNSSSTLIIPKGRYDFFSEKATKKVYSISNTSSKTECPDKTKTIGIFFQGVKNCTIEGNGSILFFHDKMITLCFDECENITIKNLSEDYMRPTMSEIQFTKVQGNTLEANVHPDSKFKIVNSTLIWHDTNWESKYFHSIMLDTSTNEMRYSIWEPLKNSKAIETEKNKVRFEEVKNFSPKAGDVLTIRDHIRDQVGAFFLKCKNIKLENVKFHYLHGLGAVFQYTSNISLKNVDFAPRKESGRYIASSADFVHISGCKGIVKIENCLFSGAHDDPVNVHGTYLRIIETKNDNVIIVRFMHHQSYNFEAFFPGDSIDFVNKNTLTSYACSTVLSVRKINETDIELKLSSSFPSNIGPDDCIENITWTPEVIIKNCIFERSNTRGILLTSRRKMVVENNTFKALGMSGILIGGDVSNWFESGKVNDLTIKNNRFFYCGYNGGVENATIAIAPENTIVDENKPVHSNIKIVNNVFHYIDNHRVIYAKSTANIEIRGNKFISKNNKNMLKNGFNEYFRIKACQNLKNKKNKFL